MIGAEGSGAVAVAAGSGTSARKVRVGVETRELGAKATPQAAATVATLKRMVRKGVQAGGVVGRGRWWRETVVVHHAPSQHVERRMAISSSIDPTERRCRLGVPSRVHTDQLVTIDLSDN